MEMIIVEIERALNAGLYYLAIAITLTLPDMCSALEDPNGETSGEKYKAWYRNNLQATYRNISDVDMWKLRCAVLHQARVSHDQMENYSRVMFSLPNPQRNRAHQNICFGTTPKGILNLDACTFCNDMKRAVREWYMKNMNNPTVQANMPYLVQVRPDGLREMGLQGLGIAVIA